MPSVQKRTQQEPVSDLTASHQTGSVYLLDVFSATKMTVLGVLFFCYIYTKKVESKCEGLINQEVTDKLFELLVPSSFLKLEMLIHLCHA